MKRKIFKQLHSFTKKGAIKFQEGDNLRFITRHVPNLPGVYIIYAYLKDGSKFLVYYGKAGMNKQGILTKVQGMAMRLNNVGRNDKCRQDIFSDYLVDKKVAFLKIHWFVTWDEQVKVNPCSLEEALYIHAPVNRNIWLN